MSAPSVEHASQASPDAGLASLIAAWSELKSYLERRSRELHEEVRNYPTPIARCDEQLTKLIEQRTRTNDNLRRVIDAGPAQSGHADQRWLAALDAFIADPQSATDDETEIAIRSRLSATLSGLRGKF
jgi:flagellar biosynthesis chaperone FliJ